MLSDGPAARTMAASAMGTDGSRSPSAATHSGALIGAPRRGNGDPAAVAAESCLAGSAASS